MEGDKDKSKARLNPWVGPGVTKDQGQVKKEAKESVRGKSHSFSREQKRTLQRALTIQEEKEKALENPESSSSDEENNEIVTKNEKEVGSKSLKPIANNVSAKQQPATIKPTTNGGKCGQEEMEEFQSLVRKKKKKSKCWNAAQEILSSEKTYVDVLKILDEFRKRIEKKISKKSEEGARIYQMNIFSILPQLLYLNSMLLEEFDKRIANWFLRPKIADVLVKQGGFLRIYSTYIDNFENTSLIFEECLKEHKSFAKIVKDVEQLPWCQGLRLNMHLLAPIQRLPRYKILLETYLKYQEETSEDFEDTKKAIEIVSSATKDTNKGLHERELMERMRRLQERCQDFPLIQAGRRSFLFLIQFFALIQAGRHLLREGELMNVTNWEVPFI